MYRINEPMAKFEIAKRPWQRVHSDFIGSQPLTVEGNRYIIVFVDSFSRFIVAEPLPDQKAHTTCDAFINRFIARFGPPKMLVTDQGSNYMGENFRNTLNVSNIQHRTSTPYHHQSNGQVERANRTPQELSAIATDEHSDKWDDVLYLITLPITVAKIQKQNIHPILSYMDMCLTAHFVLRYNFLQKHISVRKTTQNN